MGQTVTLGGDRIGSGEKMKEYLHDYEMSSHDLEQDFKSTMAPGVLYPFLKLVGTNHDSFEIDLESMVMTLPTKGPLLGSYKLQADIYLCPIRLYQGILHNNPVGIGLKMKNVYLPKLLYKTKDIIKEGSNKYNRQVSESALIKYTGISGAGRPKTGETVSRKFQCVPELAYYDIFKCYYANKQEDKAYVISVVEDEVQYNWVTRVTTDFMSWITIQENPGYTMLETTDWDSNPNLTNRFAIVVHDNTSITDIVKNVEIGMVTEAGEQHMKIYEWNGKTSGVINSHYPEGTETQVLFKYAGTDSSNPNIHIFVWANREMKWALEYLNEEQTAWVEDETFIKFYRSKWTENEGIKDLQLVPFDLENIDTMRNRLLSANTLGSEFVINEHTNLLPYSTLADTTTDGISYNAYPMNGLVVKTYQSDLFNNWLDSEFIDGENGISQITAVAVQDGKFLLDSVNFAEKMYNLLNRILVSGGTYQDWQEARWGQGATRMSESPVYVGGMAGEIMFEQVVSSSETGTEGSDDYMPLGSLGGKGKQVTKKGGEHIHIKCDEPCYIIGILSITPRICYSQGNDWDRTELDTLDDLHAPEMDGIGFQDLMVEQMAWWDTVLDGGIVDSRHSAGKQTAWINYQTAVDKCYGDFAKPEGDGFMVLNRNYSMGDDGSVLDITTYIDPAKYNYCFAYDKLDAQNFWVQIHSKIVARRKMGVQQIPNF